MFTESLEHWFSTHSLHDCSSLIYGVHNSYKLCFWLSRSNSALLCGVRYGWISILVLSLSFSRLEFRIMLWLEFRFMPWLRLGRMARALLHIIRAPPSFLLFLFHQSINHSYHSFHHSLPTGPQVFTAPTSWLDLLLTWTEMAGLGRRCFAHGREMRVHWLPS